MLIPAFASDRYLRIVRASGWYDLLVTWPFALPWTFAWLYAQLNLLAQALALAAAQSHGGPGCRRRPPLRLRDQRTKHRLIARKRRRRISL